ncbi:MULTISPECIES: hypothetical protein [unclassified Mesorhizobium]|uniref:hypothetical protein n=1 Tax=unclassified Mesorhizobium TaxID=325217 RepID=UPI00333B35FA
MIANGVEIDFVTDSFQYVLTHASSDGSFQVPHRCSTSPSTEYMQAALYCVTKSSGSIASALASQERALLPLTDIREREGAAMQRCRIFRMAASCAFGALEPDPWFPSG